MAARTHVVDGGGVSRLLRRLFVIDAGGVARNIQRLFVIDAGGVARQVFQAVNIIAANDGVSAVAVDPADATASYRLENDGDIMHGLNGVFSDFGDWIAPKGTEADYDVQADILSGSLSSGTTGSRLALSATQTWARNRTTPGISTCQLQMTIRRVADSAVMAVYTVDFDAEVT